MEGDRKATFDDYKIRLNGDADLWQLRGEWWHVTEVRVPRPLRKRPVHPRPEMADLHGGNAF